MAADKVNPRHYSDLGEYAAIHVITKWDLGFELGNALKYIQRAGRKEGEDALTDLEKAEWYMRRRLHIMAPDKHPCPSGVDILSTDAHDFEFAGEGLEAETCGHKGPAGWYCERFIGHDGPHAFQWWEYSTALEENGVWDA